MTASSLVSMFGFRPSHTDRVALRLESLGQAEQYRTGPLVSVFRRDRAAAKRAPRPVGAVSLWAPAA